MKVESFKCDGCPKIRANDTNHWWVLRKMQVSPGVVNTAKVSENTSPVFGLMLAPFENRSGVAGELHLCGEDCVQKKISEFLGGKL